MQGGQSGEQKVWNSSAHKVVCSSVGIGESDVQVLSASLASLQLKG